MAERRMFAKTIIDSDAFLDMPMSARLLYYDLSMRADDDGFVNSPKKIMRIVGATQDDLSILAIRKFIIPFESGVVVIKHWKIHNYIRKDTYNETKYKEEKATLSYDENNAYTQRAELSQQRVLPVDGQLTQDRLGKDSIELVKDSIGEREKASPSSPARHKYGSYKNVLLSDEDMDKLKDEFPTDYTDRIERLSAYIAQSGKSYKNHLAVIRNWARRDSEKAAETEKCGNPFLAMLKEENLL